MSSEKGLPKEEIAELLGKIGAKLGFICEREIHTGVSKVDFVWFDKSMKMEWFEHPKRLEGTLLLPVVGFEIEEKSSVRKILRGDVDSLNSLYPSLGVIILSRRIIETHLKRQLKVVARHPKYNTKDKQIQTKEAQRRAYKWFSTDINYAKRVASANPFRRIVVLLDDEVLELARKLNAA